MAFFDDLGKALSDATNDVSGKLNEVSQVTKLRSQISDEEKNIKQMYSQIGKAFYENNPDCTDIPYGAWISSIKQSEAKIKQYEQAIIDAKN